MARRRTGVILPGSDRATSESREWVDTWHHITAAGRRDLLLSRRRTSPPKLLQLLNSVRETGARIERSSGVTVSGVRVRVKLIDSSEDEEERDLNTRRLTRPRDTGERKTENITTTGTERRSARPNLPTPTTRFLSCKIPLFYCRFRKHTIHTQASLPLLVLAFLKGLQPRAPPPLLHFVFLHQ
jgi:hypothetical protein